MKRVGPLVVMIVIASVTLAIAEEDEERVSQFAGMR